jgi:hypothetical protein
MAVEVEGRRVNEHLRRWGCDLMLEGGDGQSARARHVASCLVG